MLGTVSKRTIWITVCAVVVAGVVVGIWHTTRPRTLGSFYSQSLSWSKCEKAECASVEVPLDYEDLEAGVLHLDIHRVPAKGGHGRPLFVNPGGPGISAADWYAEHIASGFTKPMRAAFDVVAMDPRGTGEGAPVECVSDRGADRLYTQDPTPDDTEEVAAFWKAWSEFGKACSAKSPGLAEHVSTDESARDFDIARAALGAKRMDFFGYSYGAQLGATYATLFPDKVGRMVLGSGFDSTLSWADQWAQQSRATHVALEHYAHDCVKRACPLGDSESEILASMQGLLSAADRQPIEAAGQPELTEGLAYTGILAATYSPDDWPDLTAALSAASAGQGTKLRALAFDYLGRDADGSYVGNLLDAFPAISCNDTRSRPSVRDADATIQRYAAAGPVLGRGDAWSMLSLCTGFPPALHPQGRVHAADAQPILVLGSTGDPATPIAWSDALVEQLGSAVLLTRRGEGHGAYSPEYPCMTRHVERYLLEGTLPKPSTFCAE